MIGRGASRSALGRRPGSLSSGPPIVIWGRGPKPPCPPQGLCETPMGAPECTRRPLRGACGAGGAEGRVRGRARAGSGVTATALCLLRPERHGAGSRPAWLGSPAARPAPQALTGDAPSLCAAPWPGVLSVTRSHLPPDAGDAPSSLRRPRRRSPLRPPLRRLWLPKPTTPPRFGVHYTLMGPSPGPGPSVARNVPTWPPPVRAQDERLAQKSGRGWVVRPGRRRPSSRPRWAPRGGPGRPRAAPQAPLPPLARC